MSLVVRRWTLVVRRCIQRCGGAILLLLLATGCRTGVPLDRNVQISQHMTSEDPLDVPPRTRLAPGGAPAPQPTAVQAAHFSVTDGHEPGALALAQHTTPASKPAGLRKEPSAGAASPAAAALPATTAEADTEEATVDYSELMAAFRNSPPEVQEQAIRQLVAAASHRANKTQQPGDISEQLKRSLAALPPLPEDFDEPETFPTRLATAPGSGAASSDSSEPLAESGPVSRAVVAGAEVTQPAVAPASVTTESHAVLPSGVKEHANAIPEYVPSESAAQTNPANLAALPDSALYEELVARLHRAQPGESDGDRLRREIVRRYLQVLAGDPDSAAQTLAGRPAAEQEFLRHQVLALWNMTDPDGHPVTSRRLAAALPQFRLATRHLSEAAEQLDVRSLAFCTEILSYGQITRFTSSRFEAGQKVILYCEVDNFVAEKTADGYETELQGSYEIFDADGTKVAGQVLPADRQVCDHYLRDYFIAYQMHLPSQLEPGNYRLELSMQCVKGRKYGQASVPLTIKK